MEIIIKDDSGQVALATAEMIREQLNKKPASLICFAAGHTQRETLELLAEWYKNGELEFDRCRLIGLDEWVGLAGDLPGTCLHFISENVFKPMDISPERYFFFDGCTDDLDAQCAAANAYIDRFGPIDLVVLGAGMNAHLGFNEPGVGLDLRSHVCDLDNTSKTVGTKYFESSVPLTRGITLGLRDLLSAGTLILQVTGKHKVDVVKKICDGEISNMVPASLTRNHSNAVLLIDTEAAAGISTLAYTGRC